MADMMFRYWNTDNSLTASVCPSVIAFQGYHKPYIFKPKYH